MRYDPQNKILTQARDCFGDLWDVVASRPTEFGWDVLLGHPSIGNRFVPRRGGPTIIPTEPLRDYLEEHRMTPGMVRLPISEGGVHHVRKKLGMNCIRDREQWWKQVRQELLHTEEPPIPALLDTDRLTPPDTWPKAELRRPAEFVKEGKTIPEIAGILGQKDRVVDSFCFLLFGVRRELRPWSAEENDKLIQLKKKGRSNHEIAAILGRTLGAVRSKASCLIPPQGRYGCRWTKKEKQQLIKLTKEKCPVEEIMKIMDRSRNAVVDMQREIAGTRSRKLSPKTKRGCYLWTKEEDQKLRELALADHSPAELAKLMGRTYDAIKIRCRKVGLKYRKKLARYRLPNSASSPKRGHIAGAGSGKGSPKAERGTLDWTEEENQKLGELALAGHSSAELAGLMGRTRDAIKIRCRKLGLKYDKKLARYCLPDSGSSTE